MGIYTEEIKKMMYSFGDVKSPLSDSAEYIESILQANIRSLANKADRVRTLRLGGTINTEDICFVLRRDYFKIKRILNCLAFKKLKGSLKEEDEGLEQIALEEAEPYSWMERMAGEDKFHKQKLQRVDMLTRNMSKAEYLEFTECRQASFTYRKGRGFRDFLGKYPIKEEAFEVFSYVCCDMVYCIMEEALSLREKSGKRMATRNLPLTKAEIENAVISLVSKNGNLF